ncbi:MAG: phophatidylserine decarboxylase associated domain-containing protein [Flavobacteriaceae bacterium]|nr:phophatidylserine decarboxylase associated domain-containing protein [Flavobacteriaceae bacterium]
MEIKSKSKSKVTLKKEFEQHYQRKHGVVAGFLPQQAGYIGKWLSAQVKAAKIEQERLGESYFFTPSMLIFINYINSNPLLKSQVTLMIGQGLLVHQEYEHKADYHICNLDDLYLVLNHTIQRAPIFAPDIPHTAFPISGIFVYMMFTLAGWKIFRNKEFNNHLRIVLDEWCAYLDSKESLSVITTGKYGWLSEESVIANNLDQFVTEAQKIADPIHWGFKSFNGFFHRNIIKICRPIDGIGNEAVVVSANDGTVNRLARNVKKEADFMLKSQPYSLVNMLDNSVYTDRFVGGDVLQTFLSGHDYHRWHAPISGIIKDMRIVPAFMFSELLSMGFDDSAGTLSQQYEANVNTRALIFIESPNPKIGMVCVIPIGITEISSIKFNDKIHIGDHVTKGDLLGRFSYGGSSLCTVFQPDAIKQFTVVNPENGVNSNDGPFIRVNAQTAIANI